MRENIKEWYIYALAALIVFVFFGTIALLAFVEMPAANEKLLNILLGAEISAFIGVIQYFFGSSKGSSDKTKMLNGKK